MKKVLLISGSNRNGNTNYLLRQIEQATDNSEIILLNKCNIEYCKGCLACHKIDKCVIQDDMKEIIIKIKEADLIIFGVPNYFDNVTGLFKNFMDRLHPLYKSESIRDKSVVYIFTGGGEEEGTREPRLRRTPPHKAKRTLKWSLSVEHLSVLGSTEE